MHSITYDNLDWPQFGPDTRQEGFYKIGDQLRKEVEGEVQAINTSQGYHASSVDIGWLQSRIMEIIREVPKEDITYNLISDITANVLKRSVQRLKEFSIGQNCEHIFKVHFLTRDDQGFYEYDFLLVFPEGLSEIKLTQLKSKQSLRIKEYIQDFLSKEEEQSVLVTNVKKVFEEKDIEIYQIDTSRKKFCKECDKEEENKTNFLGWRFKSWKPKEKVIICGSTYYGVRDLQLRSMLGWPDAIPPEAITLPWSEIPREIDYGMPNNRLLEEILDFLEINGFEYHYALISQLYDMINKGFKEFEFDKEEDGEEQTH